MKIRDIVGWFFALAALGAAGGAVEYNYDSLNRLTWVKYSSGAQINYIYDAAGNLTHLAQTAAPATPPGVPTLNSVTPGPGRVTLDFTAPANTGGSLIERYTATNGGGATSIVSATLPVTPAPAKKGGISAILMLLLD